MKSQSKAAAAADEAQVQADGAHVKADRAQVQADGAHVKADGVQVQENLADREARNPMLRYLMHLGLPAAGSVGVHLLIVAGLTIASFGIATVRREPVEKYKVDVFDESAADVFTWSSQPKFEEAPVKDGLIEQLLLPPDMPSPRVSERVDVAEGESGEGLGLGTGDLGILGLGQGIGDPGTGGTDGGEEGGDARIGKANVWDLEVEANRIVYVVDFSGSIVVAVEELKRELKRSVGQLVPSQAFNVIVFYEENGAMKTRNFRPKLEPANQENTEAFFTWIKSVAPKGRTKPLEAIRIAMGMEPEAVFFFSDGEFSDPDQDEAAINQANKNQKARIYSVVFDEQYLNDNSGLPPRETEGSKRMARIAKANRGKTQIITGAILKGEGKKGKEKDKKE